MVVKLTDKQERFCQEVAKMKSNPNTTFNITSCYKACYSYKNMSDNALYVEASRLYATPKISLRIEELMRPAQKKIQKEINYTALDSFKMFIKMQNIALDGPIPEKTLGSAIRCEELKAKLAGVLIEKKDITTGGEKISFTTPLEDRIKELAKNAKE